MKKNLFVLLALTTLFCISCQNNVEIEKQSEKQEVIEIAENYVNNLFVRNNISQGRSIYSTDYPDFLYNKKIIDSAGNTISFNDLEQKEKDEYVELWKKEMITSITDLLETDENILEIMQLENSATNNAIRSIAKNRNITVNFEEFTNRFFENIQKNMKKKDIFINRSSSSGNNKEITSDCLVDSSVEKLKKYYKKGRALITLGTNSSSNFTGHASLMYEPSWQEKWESNGLEKIMITSSPKGAKYVSWPDKTDGVQLEPIGYWAGNSGGSAHKVYIYNIGNYMLKWSKFLDGFKFYNASNNEYIKAADNAYKYLGKPYALGTTSTKSFYCSELVWKGWQEAGYNIDHGANGFISPLDLMVSLDTQKVISYTNK